MPVQETEYTRRMLTHRQMADRLRRVAETAADNYFHPLATTLREMADEVERSDTKHNREQDARDDRGAHTFIKLANRG